MKKYFFYAVMLLLFAAEIAALYIFSSRNTEYTLDAVAVNELVHSVQEDWDEPHAKTSLALDYVVLDKGGNVRFRTKHDLSENIHDAIVHRDTILEIEVSGRIVGKLIVYNDSISNFTARKKTLSAVFFGSIVLQLCVGIGYSHYINRTIIRPFQKLKNFAERVACGNLDVPLTMDRRNIFGAFTESFDIMRSELKLARIAEAKATADKKELIAKLSHDIKTPVASIKAASEVGAALANDEKLIDNYTQIIRKADQINTLVSNLFSATLEELQQLPVVPADFSSRELPAMLENADYLHRAEIPAIPDCLLHADPLRLQQVFDNIFANSYKYANTAVSVSITRESRRLILTVEDYGGGVDAQELPLIKEKFKRGKNAEGVEGVGLGLYISDYFMREMHGALELENGAHGLRVSVVIPQSL